MILSAQNLTFAYSRALPIFRNFNLEIEKGSYWGILGKNGAGKSTLMDLLIKFRAPQEGKIIYDDSINNDPSKILLVSHSIELNLKMTVQNFFNFHSKFFATYSTDDEKRLVNAFKINPHLNLNSLSTGQQKQVQAICSLASRPEILLMDEITGVLDPDARKIFFELIGEANHKNKTTVLLATNIKEDLKGRVSNVLFLKDGYYEIYSQSELEKVFV